MSDYRNFTEKVVNLGLNLRDAPDRLEPGKWRRLTNVRSDEEGALTSRPGRVPVIYNLNAPRDRVHTLTKLDDSFVYGIGAHMYRNNVPYESTWRSLPKTIVRHKASVGEDKWLYVSDGYQSKMFSRDGIKEYRWGIAKAQQAAVATVLTTPGALDSTGVNVYDWKYTHYSTITGAESNPSPDIPGLVVVRKAVRVMYYGSADPQVDKVRLYRRGGSLGQVGYKLVGEYANPPLQANGTLGTGFHDDVTADEELQTKPELSFDNDCPFVSYTEADGELQGTPLPYIFGPFIGKYIFGCGDLNRPNHLYWTNPGKPTSAGLLNHTVITSPDEPILGGFIYGGLPYVYTHEAFYALDYQGDDAIPPFTARKLSVGRGVSAPFCVTVGPTVFFFSKDGVYMSDMQGPAEPLSEASIRRVFVPSGQSSYTATNETGVPPIAWGDYQIQPPGVREDSVLNTVRLVFGGKLLRMFYQSNDGYVHLVNDTPYDRWSNDVLNSTDSGVFLGEEECIAFYDEEQPGTSWIIGTTKGRLLRETGLTDEGAPIQCRLRTRSVDFDMPQTLKEFGNIIIDADVNGALVPASVNPLTPNGIAITPLYNAENNPDSYQGIDGIGRQKFPLSLKDTYARSIAFDIAWDGNARVYQWDILWRMDEEWLTHWEFPPSSFGAKGWTHMRDFYISLRSTAEVTVTVLVDGVAYYPTLAGYSGAPGIIPSTSGARYKHHLWMPAVKGKLYQIKLDGGPFRLYGEDSELRVKEWATGLSYPTVNPFEAEGGGS